MNNKKTPIIVFYYLIISVLMFVGMTGFEPATTRPPDEYIIFFLFDLQHVTNVKKSFA